MEIEKMSLKELTEMVVNGANGKVEPLDDTTAKEFESRFITLANETDKSILYQKFKSILDMNIFEMNEHFFDNLSKVFNLVQEVLSYYIAQDTLKNVKHIED